MAVIVRLCSSPQTAPVVLGNEALGPIWKRSLVRAAFAGVFANRSDANNAVSQLLSMGLTKDDISLMLSEKSRDQWIKTTDDTGDRAAAGGVTGATVGGVLGALVAGLTMVGSLAVPGSSLLVAGPVVAALSGAGAGAAAGGLTGALIGAGVDAGEAGKYEKEIEAGRAVVIVHSNDNEKVESARQILRNMGGETRAA